MASPSRPQPAHPTPPRIPRSQLLTTNILRSDKLAPYRESGFISERDCQIWDEWLARHQYIQYYPHIGFLGASSATAFARIRQNKPWRLFAFMAGTGAAVFGAAYAAVARATLVHSFQEPQRMFVAKIFFGALRKLEEPVDLEQQMSNREWPTQPDITTEATTEPFATFSDDGSTGSTTPGQPHKGSPSIDQRRPAEKPPTRSRWAEIRGEKQPAQASAWETLRQAQGKSRHNQTTTGDSQEKSGALSAEKERAAAQAEFDAMLEAERNCSR